MAEGEALTVHAEMLRQRPEPWLATLAQRDFPARPVMSDGRRHPLSACPTAGCRIDRLQTKAGFEPAIYLQGFSEPTHGLSDTLLSVLVMRGAEIAASLLTNRPLHATA